jgi:hypothetical protein
MGVFFGTGNSAEKTCCTATDDNHFHGAATISV